MPWRIKLKRALRDAGVTYEQVADALNLSVGAIGHRLNGRTEPSLQEIRVMCDMAKLNIAELVSDQNFLVCDAKEMQILEALRSLPEETRAMVERMLGLDLPPKN